MAKAQLEWAEALAARQPAAQDEVAAFVSSVASSLAVGGSEGGAGAASAGLQAVVPLARFLSRSLGKCPDAVVPAVLEALQQTSQAVEAAAADAAATTGTPPGTPPGAAAGAALPAAKWVALLSQAMRELDAVHSLLPLAAEWKAQLSGAVAALLTQLLAARRHESSAMLSGLRAAIVSGRQPLPLTGADAAQVSKLWAVWAGGGAPVRIA